MKGLVAAVMKEAAGKAGKQRAFLAQIRELTGETYQETTVSSWTRGRNVPGADILLAAAKANGISLDRLLYGESFEERIARAEERLERLEGPQARGDRA